jgi:hypothetical protein
MLATTDTSSQVSFTDYCSPLLDRREEIRQQIKQQPPNMAGRLRKASSSIVRLPAATITVTYSASAR